MSSHLQATPINLADEERTELEGLARSIRTERRTRLKAQIALMEPEGAATRAIGRALGCATGTASKWRVRYAEDRLAGFSEVGERGAAPKYDEETDRRILALLNRKPPEGYANWTGPLLTKALGDVDDAIEDALLGVVGPSLTSLMTPPV
jgi:transposase